MMPCDRGASESDTVAAGCCCRGQRWLDAQASVDLIHAADDAGEYFMDAGAGGVDELRHRVFSLKAKSFVLSFLRCRPALAVAMLFRVLIEGKTQLSEIDERFDHIF